MRQALNLLLIGIVSSGLVIGCSETSATASPPVIKVIPSGEPREKLAVGSAETIPQPNCGGSATVSNSIERSRSIIYSLDFSSQVSVNADGSVGIPGVGSIQVGTSVANSYGVSYGQEDRLTRSITVQAEKGTNMEHLVQQYEYWEKGDVMITVGDTNLKLPYRFRRDFGVELLNSRNTPCPTGVSANPNLTRAPEPTSLPTLPPPVTVAESSFVCAGSVSSSEVNSWRIGAASVKTVDEYVKKFNQFQQAGSSFERGDRIPAGAVIATSFDISQKSYGEFELRPIIHRGNYGVFETTLEFIAPNEGACVYVDTQPVSVATTKPSAPITISNCEGSANERCWAIDHSARSMTWIGPTDGREDIKQYNESLRLIRSGYTAIIRTDLPGEIFACVLTIDGQVINNGCVLTPLSAGTHQITSQAEGSGGFRWCPALGTGWRENGGECR